MRWCVVQMSILWFIWRGITLYYYYYYYTVCNAAKTKTVIKMNMKSDKATTHLWRTWVFWPAGEKPRSSRLFSTAGLISSFRRLESPMIAFCATAATRMSRHALGSTWIQFSYSTTIRNRRSYSSVLAVCVNDCWSARSLPLPWNHFHSHDNAPFPIPIFPLTIPPIPTSIN